MDAHQPQRLVELREMQANPPCTASSHCRARSSTAVGTGEAAFEAAEVHPFRDHRRGAEVAARGIFDGTAGGVGRIEQRPCRAASTPQTAAREARRAELGAPFACERPQAGKVGKRTLRTATGEWFDPTAHHDHRPSSSPGAGR